ncbi:MAG: hypothetical protein FWD18_05615 [Micrococcales bacterium]|nr:hypothetical protein [Micrococcales bacterium]
MNGITRQMALTRIAITGFVAGVFDRMKGDDRGQGSVEYVGIALVVAAILTAVILMVTGNDFGIGQAIGDAVKNAINSVGS